MVNSPNQAQAPTTAASEQDLQWPALQLRNSYGTMIMALMSAMIVHLASTICGTMHAAG
jgi:hypothetical protein